MDKLEVLTNARSVIADKGWTREAYARDAEGKPLQNTNDIAQRGTCFCMLGAIEYALANVSFSCLLYSDVTRIVRESLPVTHTSIPNFNDDPATIKEDVLEVFDRAIAKVSNGL